MATNTKHNLFLETILDELSERSRAQRLTRWTFPRQEPRVNPPYLNLRTKKANFNFIYVLVFLKFYNNIEVLII